jgi:hypothetical protein
VATGQYYAQHSGDNRVVAFLFPSPYWQYDRRFRFDDRVINSMKGTMLTILRRAIRGYGKGRQLSNMAQNQTRMSAMREEIHPKTYRWAVLLGRLQTGCLPPENRTSYDLIATEDWTVLYSLLTLFPCVGAVARCASPVTSGSCQCSLRDRFPLRLCFSLRNDRPSFRGSISSR